jgi:hypothetical protein
MLSLAAVLGSLLWIEFTYLKANDGFRELLLGSQSCEIHSLLIWGQDRTVAITDPALTTYLTEAFRRGRRDQRRPGITYYVDISLSTGGSVRCALYIPKEQGVITIAFPIDATTTYYYLIELPEPLPAPLNDLLSTLQ